MGSSGGPCPVATLAQKLPTQAAPNSMPASGQPVFLSTFPQILRGGNISLFPAVFHNQPKTKLTCLPELQPPLCHHHCLGLRSPLSPGAWRLSLPGSFWGSGGGSPSPPRLARHRVSVPVSYFQGRITEAEISIKKEK